MRDNETEITVAQNLPEGGKRPLPKLGVGVTAGPKSYPNDLVLTHHLEEPSVRVTGRVDAVRGQ